MVNATNVSQKKCNTDVKRDEKVLCEAESELITHFFHPKEKMEEQYFELIRKMKNKEHLSSENYLFLVKEGTVNLRTAYGVYLSMCKKRNIKKVITWRTFYMQCSGYRTLKPNTMTALSEYIRMLIQ